MSAEAAMEAIRAERRRQVEVEGWSAEHDDAYLKAELFSAAQCYVGHALTGAGPVSPPHGWPWASEWWKPRDVRSDLIRAGALFLAEHERCGRRYAAHPDLLAQAQALPLRCVEMVARWLAGEEVAQ